MVRGKPYGSQQVASLLFPKKVKIIIIVMIMIIIILIMIMMMTNITKTYPVLQNPHISPQGLLLGLVSAFPCLHLERGESMNDDDDDWDDDDSLYIITCLPSHSIIIQGDFCSLVSP